MGEPSILRDFDGRTATKHVHPLWEWGKDVRAVGGGSVGEAKKNVPEF